MLVRGPARSSSRRRPPVAFAANLQLRRPRLPQPLHRQPQRSVLHLSLQHPPHGVPLRRPQMQQAPVVFAGNRILRLRQIKGHGAVFQHNGARGLAEKVLHGTSQSLRRHSRHGHDPFADSLTSRRRPSVTCDHRHDFPVDVPPARLRPMWDNDWVDVVRPPELSLPAARRHLNSSG